MNKDISGFYYHNGKFFIYANGGYSHQFLLYSENGVTWKIVKFDEDDAGAWFDGVGGQAIIENEDDRVCKKKIIFEDDLQKMTDKYIKMIDGAVEVKTKEVMTV